MVATADLPHRAQGIADEEQIRARGGKVVFVRFPYTGELKALEDRLSPREKTWDPLLKATNVPGIHGISGGEMRPFGAV